MRVAIFASGNGTNFEVLADKFAKKEITGNLVLLFCDHPNAPVIKRAEKFNIPYETFTVKECGNKLDYEKRIVEVLKAHQIDFIALAGYMRIIGKPILDEYEGSIINLHPAYLPEYQGLHAIERAFADHKEHNKDQTGVTLHYIDSGLDLGPVIYQEHVPIYQDDTCETLEERIHECEHRIYPKVLNEVLLSKSNN
ncbi:phosphoribosylglycinamide formyltransferase [Ligilactobacillus salivarius]|uniref:phosphoribosylglycinamide formyltransferase n=1 Tax=Ligilactobacillus salivarius TaxID=1624 RepID=UPI0025A4A869|nr:phosphoribosylglycinamide formyltransferase [Ligilactobacillus salivarius]MDM8223120.1 phosphoribosylglycinamide formyltransferase [Ligilactobacillus salivarius]